LRLSGDPEEALDKLRLPYRVSPIQSLDLPLPYHVHRLDPFQRLLGCVEGSKATEPLATSPRGYTQTEREQILRAYEECSSLRGLTRTFGVARNTVSSWLKEKKS
jgi:hypothetical protein